MYMKFCKIVCICNLLLLETLTEIMLRTAKTLTFRLVKVRGIEIVQYL